ncbi:MAG TPA: rhodanese-like domain-containing protein [Usitatibacter sp.]|nr:rhodanese-like domain-containing protein [Usitatibacter sp.]
MGDFVVQHLGLVAVFVASGLMLVWPELSRLVGGADEIGTLDATRLMNQGSTLVLDVGEDKDFAAGHLPRARNIPVRDLAGRLEEIARYREKAVIVSARSNTQAAAAVRALKRAGFKSVYQLKGGLAAWQQASLPVEK